MLRLTYKLHFLPVVGNFILEYYNLHYFSRELSYTMRKGLRIR